MNKTASTLSVNTKRGPVTFETQLMWKDAIDLCAEESRNGNVFAYNLVCREHSGLFMSESQVSWVYKIAEDVLKLRQPAPKQRSTDASEILGSLAEARARGIKKPALRLQTNSGKSMLIKYMSVGSNAGGCWVLEGHRLVGKIDDCGTFTSGCTGPTDEYFEFIECTNSDVKGALTEFGKITSRCGCCGLPLTNKKSIELGIGPICLDKYGLLAFAK